MRSRALVRFDICLKFGRKIAKKQQSLNSGRYQVTAVNEGREVQSVVKKPLDLQCGCLLEWLRLVNYHLQLAVPVDL